MNHSTRVVNESMHFFLFSCLVFSGQVLLDSLRSQGLWPARLLCPWNFQARILEWVVISLSRGSSPPGDPMHVSCVAGRFSTAEPPGINERMALEPLSTCERNPNPETGLQNKNPQVPGSENRDGISVLKSKGRVGYRDLCSEA